MKFTKYNNPAKKRRVVRKSYTDACIDVVKEMLIDKRLGYEIPTEYYEDKANRIAGKK